MIKLVNEKKSDLMLVAREIPLLKSLSDDTISKIVNCYAKDNGLYPAMVKPDELKDTLANFEDLADILFTWFPYLSDKAVREIILADEKLQKAIFNTALEYDFIDNNGDSTIEIEGESDGKVPMKDLINWVLYDTVDAADTDAALKDVFKNYSKLTEALIEEDTVTIEPVPAEPQKVEIPDEESTEAEEKIEEPLEAVAIDTSIMQNACVDEINSIIKDFWAITASINGMIGTLDSEYKDADKEEIKEILSGVSDDAIVSIGMLQKTISIIDSRKSDLISSGIEKAEELVNKSNFEVTSEQ